MQILFPKPQYSEFKEEILTFLENHSIDYLADCSPDGNEIYFPSQKLRMRLQPLPTQQQPQLQAQQQQPQLQPRQSGYDKTYSSDTETFILSEDRWKNSPAITAQRLLSRIGQFRRIHARLCKIISEKNCKSNGMSPTAFNSKVKKFLDTFHTYGYLPEHISYLLTYKGDIVAAGEFRKTYTQKTTDTDRHTHTETDTQKPGSTGAAYEWTRYASLPDVRIAGGMGKMLKTFIAEERETNKVVEIMSYSDNEWSNGDAYKKLGFELSGSLKSTTYRIDPETYKRLNPRQWALRKKNLSDKEAAKYPEITNIGSRKWVLKLSDEDKKTEYLPGDGVS